ncbi:MAG: DUF1549 domain-containing protein, partial [Planctomycetes bacterium]|nr:DUF1549 domain-containing protein [Planctomycetota bacterium]
MPILVNSLCSELACSSDEIFTLVTELVTSQSSDLPSSEFDMKTKSIAWFLLGLALIALPSEFVLLLAQESSTKESATSPLDRVDFVRDVLPIFQRSCSKCHGTEIQKSSYRLDVRSVAITGGESSAPNIVPGKSADSPLIRLIEGNGDLVMPPEGNRLTLHEVTMLRRWIDEGATWPDDVAGTVDDKLDWWSLKPLPEVVELAKLLSDQEVKADSKPAISQNASLTIDRFVRATLRQQGIQLSPLADRRTLIRRLYFDLVGLPPSIEETTAYIADMDSDERAYEKIVDNLLASPRYGERWARHWLDAAHFAETHGHDQDR